MVSANSSAWLSPATPSPYSSAWISTMADLAPPLRRGMPQVWGSASLRWYADRCTANSSNCTRVPPSSM